MTGRPYFFMIAAISAMALIFLPKEAAAKDKKKHAVLCTVDIDQDYEILGLVSHRSNELEPAEMQRALQRKADKIGADYVVGIIYYSNAGYVYSTGTAVKLKKDK